VILTQKVPWGECLISSTTFIESGAFLLCGTSDGKYILCSTEKLCKMTSVSESDFPSPSQSRSRAADHSANLYYNHNHGDDHAPKVMFTFISALSAMDKVGGTDDSGPGKDCVIGSLTDTQLFASTGHTNTTSNTMAGKRSGNTDGMWLLASASLERGLSFWLHSYIHTKTDRRGERERERESDKYRY
jgi:hypothetical protein